MSIVYKTDIVVIHRFCEPGLESNMYILLSRDSGKDDVIVVDPCVCKEAIELLQKKPITRIYILLSHEHYDHISGVNYFREMFSEEKVFVVCSEKCAERIMLPNLNLALYWDFLIEGLDDQKREQAEKIKNTEYCCHADIVFEEAHIFTWNNITINMKKAEGHSPGGCLIYLGDEVVFTGDNLINGNVVLCRLPGGSKRQYLENTKPLLMNIGNEVLICPGHGECGYINDLLQYI